MQPTQTVSTQDDPSDLLESSDKVLDIIHKHWIGIVGIYFLALATALTTVVLTIFVIPDLQLSSETLRLIIAAAVACTILLAVIFYVIVYVYEQSKLTITDRSLVQMVQKRTFQ